MKGASTAVTAIAFICAIPLPSGHDFLTAVGGKGPIHDVRDDTWCWVGGEGPQHYFYNDLPKEEADRWSQLLRAQSWGAYFEQVPGEAYLDIASGYLFCTKDQALPHWAQKGLVEEAIKAGAQMEHTETVDTGHSPFLIMPERTAQFVRRMAGENVESSD